MEKSGQTAYCSDIPPKRPKKKIPKSAEPSNKKEKIMTAEKTLFQIDIRYDEPANGAEMQALADELVRRGHTVHVKKYSPKGSFVDDLTRSARDFKELADNVRGVAENGMQMLRGMAEAFVKPVDVG
jgi:hypothetical protein